MRKSTDIIQVALILSAIDTALQAFAPFRRIGGGLLSGLPTSALGQNVGIICSNKVVNKWVFVIIAAVFAIAVCSRSSLPCSPPSRSPSSAARPSASLAPSP
ncbi:hypothetical protein ACTQ40_00135 [Collinsella sp. Sow4_D11]|uniref:hypothetical protein n=1 Tax=Collinsella sp. Sow4_D11 TaxID=3438775 RepID=UPI003F9155F7